MQKWGGVTASWPNRRIHWMSAQPPPIVMGSPNRFHHLSQQNIVLARDGERLAVVAVSLDWVPGPSGVPWIPPLVILFAVGRSEEHTSELQSHLNLVCRLLLEKKKRLVLVKKHH